MLSCHRCCIRRWRRGRNHSGSVARSVLDCYQFIFWRKRSGSSTVGFLWRVYSNVCAANCWRLPGNWPASWVTSHDFRYRNTSKQSFVKRRHPITTIKVISIDCYQHAGENKKHGNLHGQGIPGDGFLPCQRLILFWLLNSQRGLSRQYARDGTKMWYCIRWSQHACYDLQ